jgi:hypothetical protein
MAGRIAYYGNIVRDGLVLNLDAAKRDSYPGSGTVWRDIIGPNNGTLVNGPTFDNENDGSIVFDGVDDYINCSDVLDLGTNDCTINTWIKINSSWPSSVRYILSKALASAQNYRYGLSITQTRQLQGFVQGNGGGDIIPVTINTMNLNQWYMCTMVINRSSSIQLYINGILQTLTGSATISQWNGLNFQSPNPLRLGSYTASNNTASILNIPGNISQTLMYFRALTSQEVLQNYNATKTRYGL